MFSVRWKRRAPRPVDLRSSNSDVEHCVPQWTAGIETPPCKRRNQKCFWEERSFQGKVHLLVSGEIEARIGKRDATGKWLGTVAISLEREP